MSKSHIVIPDCHIRPGSNMEFLTSVGNFIADKQPDVVVNIGDFADMPSLSSYDVGKREFEGRRYHNDIKSVHDANKLLLSPLRELQHSQRKQKRKVYNPELVLTIGNHEHRIDRAVSNDAKLEGILTIQDLGYEKAGWDVKEFLAPVDIDGIRYCHYFTSGVMGNPAASAKALLRAECCSAVMGHVQKREVEVHPKTNFTTVFVGTCYFDKQDYLGPQGNLLIPGVWHFTDIVDGIFDYQFISLKKLINDYS